MNRRHQCIIVDCSPPEVFPVAPATARDRFRLMYRLSRLGRRLDAARGNVMNLDWLHWYGEWTKVWEALGSPEEDPKVTLARIMEPRDLCAMEIVRDRLLFPPER